MNRRDIDYGPPEPVCEGDADCACCDYEIVTYGNRNGTHVVHKSGDVHSAHKRFNFGYVDCPTRKEAMEQAEECRDELNGVKP